MSDLTICNYCRLQGIRRRAKESGKKVATKAGGFPEFPTGTSVFRHPKEVKDKNRFQEQYRVAWFMELTGGCAC